MKIKTVGLFLLLFVFSSTTSILAIKKLVRRQSGGISSQSHGVVIKPKLRADRQALLVVFSGMDKAKTVNYNLTYQSGEVGQGVQGSYDAASGNTQKELVFGTCSGIVCTYHQNIKDMVLEVKSSLKSGKTLTQRFQIKP